MANKRRLEAEPETIAAAIMESSTRKEAAERLGVPVRTLYDYMKSFEVQAVVSSLRADQLRERMQTLEDAQRQAIETITGILKSDEATNGDKLKAAALILNAGAAARSEYKLTEESAVGKLRSAAKLECERNNEIIIDFSKSDFQF